MKKSRNTSLWPPPEEIANRLQSWLFLRGCYDELLEAKTPAEGRHWRAAVEKFRVFCGLAEDRWRDRLRDHLKRENEREVA